MKMLHTTVIIRLLVLLILAVHTAPAVRRTSWRRIIGNRRRVPPVIQIRMTLYANSIDDDFAGCREEMYEEVRQRLDTELEYSWNFRNAWNKAKEASGLINISNSNLTEEKLMTVAVRAYTDRDIYTQLNEKMREDRKTYKIFHLKSLHFLITDGIQTLNANRTCQTTYRRTSVAIDITDPFVRFGSFASSSFKPDLIRFGTKTCFKITTCHGSDISALSQYNESEVLIPPYEVFINEPGTDIPELKDCNHVYKLKSVGTISVMKCELVKKKPFAFPKLLTYDFHFN